MHVELCVCVFVLFTLPYFYTSLQLGKTIETVEMGLNYFATRSIVLARCLGSSMTCACGTACVRACLLHYLIVFTC